jgi:hypothetical protein
MGSKLDTTASNADRTGEARAALACRTVAAVGRHDAPPLATKSPA